MKHRSKALGPGRDEFLISAAALSSILDDENIRVIDASWHLDQRDGRSEFMERHIPGARFFDIVEISDRSTGLPHMLPEPRHFERAMAQLGVSELNDVVIYDASDVHSAARLWWMFRAMGMHRVHILDGGLAKWIGEGRPVESGMPAAGSATFVAHPDQSVVRTMDRVRVEAASGGQIVDARPEARFLGIAPEPRAGVRPGHIPGSCNIPLAGFYAPDGTMAATSVIRALFETTGIDLSQPVTATCGSGMGACSVALALAMLGCDFAVYDGAWAEWGAVARHD